MSTPSRAESPRDRLLDAAEALLERGGPAAITLRAVGDGAGVSRQAPYRRFRDKRALLEGLAARCFTDLRAGLAAVERSADAARDAQAFAAAFVAFALAHPERYRFMVGDVLADTADPELLRASHETFAMLEHAVLRCRVAAGRPDDGGRTAVLLYTGLHGLVSLGSGGLLAEQKGLAPGGLVGDLVDRLVGRG